MSHSFRENFEFSVWLSTSLSSKVRLPPLISCLPFFLSLLFFPFLSHFPASLLLSIPWTVLSFSHNGTQWVKEEIVYPLFTLCSFSFTTTYIETFLCLQCVFIMWSSSFPQLDTRPTPDPCLLGPEAFTFLAWCPWKSQSSSSMFSFSVKVFSSMAVQTLSRYVLTHRTPKILEAICSIAPFSFTSHFIFTLPSSWKRFGYDEISPIPYSGWCDWIDFGTVFPPFFT